MEQIRLGRSAAQRMTSARSDEQVEGYLREGRVKCLVTVDSELAVATLPDVSSDLEPWWLDVQDLPREVRDFADSERRSLNYLGAYPVRERASGQDAIVSGQDAIASALNHAVSGQDAVTTCIDAATATHFFGWEAPDKSVLPGAHWIRLSTCAHLLSDLSFGLAYSQVALARWHEQQKYCSNCGRRTQFVQGGWEAYCSNGHITYPRQDPAVIAAVQNHRGELLLGRKQVWPTYKFAPLAGFVEAGETAEDAVRREIFEEAGVLVEHVEFVASQPWPFPQTLLLAFRAWTHDTQSDVHVDGEELAVAKFYSRQELGAELAAGNLIPPGYSVAARTLIEDWYGAPLPSSEAADNKNFGAL